MSDDLGLRERKKRDRRRRIEEAAITLFEERGFDGTTIEDIAAAAQISPRTFFSYFATKEDVALADYAARLDRILEELRGRPGEEPLWAAVRASFVTVASDYAARRDELVRRFAIMAATPSIHARSLQLQSGWEDALAAVLAERAGPSSDDLGCRLLAASALAAMRSSLQHWLLTGHERPLPELIDRCFAALADGLADVAALDQK